MATPMQVYQNYKAGRVEKILDLLIKESRFGKDDLLQEAIRDNVMVEIVKTKRYDLISDFISLMDGSILLYQSIHQPLFEVKEIHVLHHLALKLCQLPDLVPIFFQENQFPLLDELVQYVHLEGEEGELSRVAFELLVKLEPTEIQEYIVKSEFCGIVMASLCGLYCQLPETLTKVDMRTFISFYEFVQSCITYSKGEVHNVLIGQFQSLFLAQVVAAGIQSSSDFDGSTAAWIFYIQTIVDHTNDATMLQHIAGTLFRESDGDDLNTRDILMSKLTSLSEAVVVGVLQIMHSMIKKWDGSLVVLFPGLEPVAEMHIQVGEHVQILNRLMDVCSNKQGLESYVSDAVGKLEEISKRKGRSEQNQEETTDLQEQLEKVVNSSLWMKLMDKLQTFFSQSMNVNLALTGLLAVLALEPHPVIYHLLFFSSRNLVDQMVKLCQEIPGGSSARMRMDLIKKELERNENMLREADQVWNQERETWKNCVILEEFTKEIVGSVLMRGSTCREHISYV
jgi:hypothetical protein